MVSPVMTATEARSHGTFMALLWALSNPGRIESLPRDVDDSLAAIADVLIDLETSFFSPDAALAARLARTGARRASSDVARYQFFRRLTSADVTTLESIPTGSYLYPDDAATVVVGCALGAKSADRWRVSSPGGPTSSAAHRLSPEANRPSTRLKLTGPGVKDTAVLDVVDVPRELWATRERAIRYPLGWDLFLVAGHRVVGIPRTTVVEVET